MRLLTENMEEKFDSGDSFYNSFRPLLVFAQICGLMPLRGIFGSSHRDLFFTWKNLTHLYAAAIASVTVFFDVFFTRENLKGQFAIDNYASTEFYSVCLLTSYLFLRVSQIFPDIAKDFALLESTMRDYGHSKRLRRQTFMFLIIFSVWATVEHCTMGLLHLIKAWNRDSNGTESFGNSFYIEHFPAISLVVPYYGWLTVAFFSTNAICTFNWNFIDFFLIGISLQVTAKFEKINDKLSSCNPNACDPAFWSKTYEDYGRLVLLTKKLDRVLSFVILTSFFSDLYHLSLQLLRSIRSFGTLFHKLYFIFSLSYLTVRFLTTLFFMARVHSVSKKPKDVLLTLDIHCVQSLRFLEQVLTDDIHFTGNRFFTINQTFVFTVIGTVVTYQVALLQFNSLTFDD